MGPSEAVRAAEAAHASLGQARNLELITALNAQVKFI